MKSSIEQLKYDLDQGDFDPHIFRQSIHSSIWELVEQIKLTPEDEGLTPEQEKNYMTLIVTYVQTCVSTSKSFQAQIIDLIYCMGIPFVCYRFGINTLG